MVSAMIYLCSKETACSIRMRGPPDFDRPKMVQGHKIHSIVHWTATGRPSGRTVLQNS